MVGPAGLIVNAARTVARFAADLLCVRSFGFQSHVRRRFEIAHNLRMTVRATFGADIFGTRNLRGSEHGACGGRAGDQANRSDQRAESQQDAGATATPFQDRGF